MKLFLAVFFLLLIIEPEITFAANYDWVGGVSGDESNWNNAANWRLNGDDAAVAISIPTLSDVIRIGVNIAVSAQPIVFADAQCASITIAANSAYTLISNAYLFVDFDINYLFPAGGEGGGDITHTLGGSGTIDCSNINLGDATLPTSGTGVALFRVNVSVNKLLIFGNMVFNSGKALNSTYTFTSGIAHVSGTIELHGQFFRSIHNGSTQLVATLTGDYDGFVGDFDAFDTNLILHYPDAIPDKAGFVNYARHGTGIGTVTYANNDAATIQNVYTGADNYDYDCINFSGTATKRLLAGELQLFANWTSAGGKIDALTNSATVRSGGPNDYQTYTQTYIDNGSDGGVGVQFYRLSFRSGPSFASINRRFSIGNFSIAATGNLLFENIRIPVIVSTGASFTLKSSNVSTAAIGTITSGSSITGTIRSERFVKGSNDLSKRGYRLLSSVVNNATPTIGGTTVRTYNNNYLLNSAFVSGLSGGGFNVTGNPSLYLYREDLIPTGATFTSSNYKGIAALSTSSPFAVRTQNRANTTYTSDTTVNIPIGTGLLFFFRGNKSDNSTQSGTKTTLPFDFPEDVVFTSTGNLNQGTVNVRTWFAKSNQLQLQYSTSIANNVSPRNVRGYHLVGNPYASSINWNKLNRNTTAANSTIYAPNIEATIWFFNPTNKQYEAYLNPNLAASDTANAVVAGTGSASNLIASGQGFFIRTKSGGSTMRFTESAKTITQPAAASLNKLMGIPVSTAEGIQPYMRIQLKKDSVNDDDILIRFFENGHEDYVLDEDAEDLGGNGALVSLSSFSGDKKSKLAINGMPPVSSVKKISLFADATASGLYELHRKELVGLADIYQVWLKDNFTKDSLDFRQNDTYTFRIDKNNAASFGDNRFELVFRKKPLPPYELLSFTAEKVKEGALLKWKVLNEYAYTQFTVQKSDGSESYIYIGKMNSDGAGNYSYIDTRYSGETSSYRILQNKPDGTEAFSSIATLKNIPQKAFAIYPNPVQSSVNVLLPDDEKYQLKITDIKGRILFNKQINRKTGSLDASFIKAGIYIIEILNLKTFAIVYQDSFVKL